MPPKKDLTGQRFGRLVVLEEVSRPEKREVFWRCKCDCGNENVVPTPKLTQNNTKSCGCLKSDKSKERMTKHGMFGTPTHNTWVGMKDRCYNPNHAKYRYYGGQGIGVCERWWDFRNFYEDMGEKPEGCSLDRINNKEDYKPDNCRWVDIYEQTQNRKAKGYCWDKKQQKWIAYINTNYKRILLGSFDSEEEAQDAYREAKIKYHGVDPFEKW